MPIVKTIIQTFQELTKQYKAQLQKLREQNESVEACYLRNVNLAVTAAHVEL